MKRLLPVIALLALSACATLPETPTQQPGQAVFSDIRLDSENPGLAKLAKPQYENPILPGFYPDPSITRAGDDYYLINSTFAYYPGIPVWKSHDLVHWKQIGNAIDRPGMLDFSGLATSRGVFAPDISYHAGLFYIVNTCVDCGGNFLITAKDPAGPWSDPVWFDFDGIDPSLFWDDDGTGTPDRAYLVNNGAPEGTPLYEGHRALWLQEFDPKTQKLIGPRQVVVNGGVNIAKKPVWIEGPHIFKKGGFYYLTAAEGGTEVNHSQVVLRSDKVSGPYLPYADNPILTQRDLDPARPNPVANTGHADLVETPDGQWFAAFLAVQPYQSDLFNTGRQTFMLPVTWKEGWPVILPKGEAVPLMADLPNLPGQVQEPHYTRYSHHFGYSYGGVTPLDWLQIRTPKSDFLTVFNDETVGLTALPEAIGDVQSHPAFIGLRQKHVNASFSTVINYRPLTEGDRAGILALQNDNFYIFYGLAMRDGKTVLEITRRAGPNDPRDGVVIATLAAPSGSVNLHAEITGGTARFTYGPDAKNATIAAENVDVTNLSTTKAGGFVGTIIGLYATGKTP